MEKIYRVKLNKNGAPNFATAEEGVLCKECKHRTDSKAKPFCEKWLREVDADVFCSYGEREGE